MVTVLLVDDCVLQGLMLAQLCHLSQLQDGAYAVC